jgi:hypothetical protein
MKKVTVNGVDHELSPDSPRSRSHVELLQDIVTSVNALEAGTSPDGIELTNANATKNVITSASSDATTTSSVAAMTFKNTVAHTANDLEFDFQKSDATSLLKIDKEGDTTVAGTMSVAGSTLALTGVGANTITTGSADAATSSSVAALTIKPTVAITAGDLLVDFQNSAGASKFAVSASGDLTTPVGSYISWTGGGRINGGVYTLVIEHANGASMNNCYINGDVNGGIIGLQADGASAVAINMNAATALTSAGAKIVNFKNATVSKAFIDKDGAVGIGGIGALPSASATYRGCLWVVQGAGGAADVCYVCLKSAADTYSWKTVSTG